MHNVSSGPIRCFGRAKEMRTNGIRAIDSVSCEGSELASFVVELYAEVDTEQWEYIRHRERL